jgi:hypothetical protein
MMERQEFPVQSTSTLSGGFSISRNTLPFFPKARSNWAFPWFPVCSTHFP